MALIDRLEPLCDLLLGAAYADDDFKDREQEEVRGLLEDLVGGELPAQLEIRINTFDAKGFELAATAHHFLGDTVDDRKRVLTLCAAINDADEEVDFAEDAYLRALATALELPAAALAGLTIDVEVDELKETFEKVRKGPPPPPKRATPPKA
ncbi:MAG: TerB family tellurite resistance protein [Proteobacteria bacterium]|nr:TerB family tellurite resistance protein [Pseudomonadota bacterium]